MYGFCNGPLAHEANMVQLSANRKIGTVLFSCFFIPVRRSRVLKSLTIDSDPVLQIDIRP